MTAWFLAGEFPRGATRFPGAEELRMLRAIEWLALREAASHGAYCATFRGCRVEAARQCRAGSDALALVHLCVSLGETIVARGLVALDSGGMEPTP